MEQLYDQSKRNDAALFAPGGIYYNTNLKGIHFNQFGEEVKRYDFGSGTITNTGVIWMANAFTGATYSISSWRWHGAGVGTVASAVGDINLTLTAVGLSGGAGRAEGVASIPTTAQYRSVATYTFSAPLAITEWGLFDVATSASPVGVLWDRKQFAAVNVVSGDSIQFTYTLSISAGG